MQPGWSASDVPGRAALQNPGFVSLDPGDELEQRSDLLVSTLRDDVAAIGGTLRLMVDFEDRPPVEIESLGALDKPRRPKARVAEAAVRRPRRKRTAA